MAMKRRRTVLAKGFQVIGSGVAFMAGKAVLRINGVPFFHARISVSFGEDGCSGNRNAASVTLDERLLLDENIKLHGVDEQVIRLDGELLQSSGHSLAASLIDVPGIDALSIDFCDGPSESVLVNAHGKFGASLGRKFFRVIETNNAALGIENDRGGNDRAEERAAAGFIETGDAHPAKLSRLSLETGRAESVHCAEILARRAGRTRLVVTKRGNGIDLHGSAGRYVVCRERYDGQQKSDAGKRDWIDWPHTIEHFDHQPRK
jgi:hypothetical protein